MDKEKLKRITEIIDNLTATINTMSENDGIQNKLEMFKIPRARKSELIKKRNELLTKYNLKWKQQ